MELIDKNKIINSGLAKGFVRWDEIKYAEPILTIPKNPTNGDMIKAMFPKYYQWILSYLDNAKWWNAPYKKEV